MSNEITFKLDPGPLLAQGGIGDRNRVTLCNRSPIPFGIVPLIRSPNRWRAEDAGRFSHDIGFEAVAADDSVGAAQVALRRFLSVRVWRAKLHAAVPWRIVTISPESTDSERA